MGCLLGCGLVGTAAISVVLAFVFGGPSWGVAVTAIWLFTFCSNVETHP